MASPEPREISLLVEYDGDGEPTTVRYLDQEGCGHESKNIDLSQPLSYLVAYHLGHLKRAHKIEPEKFCTYEALLTVDGEAVKFSCTLKQHGGDVRHQLS